MQAGGDREEPPESDAAVPADVCGERPRGRPANGAPRVRPGGTNLRVAAVATLTTGGRTLTDEQADLILDSPRAAPVHQVDKYSAVGTVEQAGEYLDHFGKQTDADKLIVAHRSSIPEGRFRSAELHAPSDADGPLRAPLGAPPRCGRVLGRRVSRTVLFIDPPWDEPAVPTLCAAGPFARAGPVARAARPFSATPRSFMHQCIACCWTSRPPPGPADSGGTHATSRATTSIDRD